MDDRTMLDALKRNKKAEELEKLAKASAKCGFIGMASYYLVAARELRSKKDE